MVLVESESQQVQVTLRLCLYLNIKLHLQLLSDHWKLCLSQDLLCCTVSMMRTFLRNTNCKFGKFWIVLSWNWSRSVFIFEQKSRNSTCEVSRNITLHFSSDNLKCDDTIWRTYMQLYIDLIYIYIFKFTVPTTAGTGERRCLFLSPVEKLILRLSLFKNALWRWGCCASLVEEQVITVL